MYVIGVYLDFLAWLIVGVAIGYFGPRIIDRMQRANANIERDLDLLRNLPPPAPDRDDEYEDRRSA